MKRFNTATNKPMEQTKMKLRQVIYLIPDESGRLENASRLPILQYLDEEGNWQAVETVQIPISHEEAVKLYQKGEFK